MPLLQWENLASRISLLVGCGTVILSVLGLPPRRLVEHFEMILRRWAASGVFCFILIPALCFAVNAFIALHNGIPHPKIHDEFSYLLAGDTFSHGRLTNPSPPFPEHFESPQELVRPTRMSKYPPGQGAALMLGRALFGEPILGVWVSPAAACAAIYWMLRAFVPPPWALVGGVMAAFSPTLLDWSQNYWGGSVAVLGGALLLGAWGRLLGRATVGSSFWLGIGLVILANTRPYEGLVTGLPLMFALAIHQRNSLLRRTTPAGIVLLLGACWMGYYNFRITGHALRMPFAEYASQYDVYPKFWLQSLRKVPGYTNPSQQWVHTEFEKGSYEQLRTLNGFARISIHRVWLWIDGGLKLSVLLVPLTMAITAWPDVRSRWLFVTGLVFLTGLWTENFVLPHYTAPALPLLFLLVMIGWTKLWHCRPIGQSVARAVGIGFLAGALMIACRGVSDDSQIVDQQTLQARLPPGRHLIFVRYNARYPFNNEFVYNPADLQSSPVLWVRYCGPVADAPVIQYFTGRQVWLLDAGDRLILNPLPSR